MSERLARADPSNAKAQHGLSVNHNRLGNMQMQLGESKAALASYKEGLAIRRTARQGQSEQRQAQRDLSVSYNRLGDVRCGWETKGSVGVQHAGSGGGRAARQADPQSVEAQTRRVRQLQQNGRRADATGRQQGGTGVPPKELQIRQRLAKADPNNAQAQRDVSVSYNKLGDVRLQRGESPAARAAYQEGLVVSERLARAEPQSAQAQHDLLFSYYELGNLEQQVGQFKKAADWYSRALDVPKRFARPQVFKQVAGVIESRLRVCRAADEALADPTAALKQPEELRPLVLSAVCSALVRQKKPDKAIAAAELLAANATEAGHLYDAACTYSLCVPLTATADGKERRAIRAVALLRQAFAKGYKDAAHMMTDTDLDALRGREDFKKLLAEMETAGGAKKAKAP